MGIAGTKRPTPPERTQQAGKVVSRPPPVGGWNARDALASMPPTDAVKLINWFPYTTYIGVRPGYTASVTGFAAAVETLAPYNGNTTSKLFAASGTAIYDASTPGVVGAAVQSGLSNARWQDLNFTTTGGVKYLVMVNGADSPRYYDGTNWTAVTGVSTPAITGLSFNTSEFINVGTHKSRLWFTRKNTLECYYLPAGLAGGAASLFDLRPVFKRGGTLVGIDTWTIDAGQGLDDHLVAVTDQGEVAIYKGTDPSSASTWTLVGVYYVGGVVGRRPFCRFGGDLLLICQYGLLPVSSLLQSVVLNTQQTLTYKIQQAISFAISTYSGNFGWQCVSFPKENALLLNVPISSTQIEQYVMNTITGAWCQFRNWNASCFCVFRDNLYWGGATSVNVSWLNNDDNGSTITTDLETAFDYFDAPGRLKRFTMCRPIIYTDGSPGITYGINLDYDDSTVTGVPTFVPSSSSTWDGALWDSGIWGGGLALNKTWQFIGGLGYAAAFRMATASRGITVQLSAIDYLFEPGGVL